MNMNILIKMLIVAMVVTMSGCAMSPFGKVTSGGATYMYSKNKEGCTVQITSAREVSEGSIKIGKDCELKTEASALTGNDGLLKIMGGLINRLPE